MITLSAKEHFQKVFDASAVASLADNINSPFMKTAMVFAESVMAERGFTSEQIYGATQFRNILLNLCLEEKEPTQIPIKSLMEFPLQQTKK